MNGQNPELTAHLAHIEREKVRAYAAATLTWKCPKPSEQEEWTRRYEAENARLAALSPAERDVELAWTHA